MKNTPYSGSAARQLPDSTQLRRIRNVIDRELSDLQRQTLTDHYFRRMSICAIARKRGVHKSTVLRTLRRAENNLRKYLTY